MLFMSHHQYLFLDPPTTTEPSAWILQYPSAKQERDWRSAYCQLATNGGNLQDREKLFNCGYFGTGSMGIRRVPMLVCFLELEVSRYYTV
jgi:hypothetical protein